MKMVLGVVGSLLLVVLAAKALVALLMSGVPSPVIAVVVLGVFGTVMYVWDMKESKYKNGK